jgi:DeoR/GlpR family transcriptional regulator of sugar metabolism
VLDTTAVEVPTKRAMIAASDQVVLLADASKFPGRGMARVCGPQELDVVVTDAPADSPTPSLLREAGVDVRQAVRPAGSVATG